MRVSLVAAVLGAALFASPPFAIGEDRVVATVNGKPITETDIELAEREVGADPELSPEEQRRVLLEVLIQRQALAGAAEQAELQNDKDFDPRLAYARRTVLQQLFLEKRSREAVTEADAKRLYDEQITPMKPEEEVQVRQIVVESEGAAGDMRRRISKGEDFATLAKSVSIDHESAPRGGDLGWHTKSELPEKLAATAFKPGMNGDLSPPIQTEAGWHVIRVEDRRMRTVPSFAELKDDLERALSKRAAKELAQRLRKEAQVVYSDPSLELAAATASAAPAPMGPAPAVAPPPSPPPAPLAAAAPADAAAPATRAAVPVAAAMSEPFEMPATAKVTHWRYDGSIMNLLADGERVLVKYDAPREGLDATGVVPGAPLFWGTRRLGTYSGQASAYTPTCGVRDYAVSGKAAADGNSFTVRGNRPVVDEKCEIASVVEEVLVFEYAGSASR